MRRQNLLLISTMLLGLITGCDSTSKIVVNTIYLDTDDNTTVKVDVNNALEVLNVESNIDLGTKKIYTPLFPEWSYYPLASERSLSSTLLLDYFYFLP